MDTILLGWPFVALASGLGGVVALLVYPRKTARFSDPSWLAMLLLPVYMIHQFEEHGFDALGRRYHFLSELCGSLGYPDVAACPADPLFIAAVNVGAVWLAGGLAIAFRTKDPRVGLFGWAIPLVNAVLHIRASVSEVAYTSGLVTSVVLFVPLGVHVVRTFVRAGLVPIRHVFLVIATGAALHGVLVGALVASAHGYLPRPLMLVIETLNGLLPLAVATLYARSARTAAHPP